MVGLCWLIAVRYVDILAYLKMFVNTSKIPIDNLDIYATLSVVIDDYTVEVI